MCPADVRTGEAGVSVGVVLDYLESPSLRQGSPAFRVFRIPGPHRDQDSGVGRFVVL
jgi:hypothetical protein